jgi:hypothetical protein
MTIKNFNFSYTCNNSQDIKTIQVSLSDPFKDVVAFVAKVFRLPRAYIYDSVGTELHSLVSIPEGARLIVLPMRYNSLPGNCRITAIRLHISDHLSTEEKRVEVVKARKKKWEECGSNQAFIFVVLDPKDVDVLTNNLTSIKESELYFIFHYGKICSITTIAENWGKEYTGWRLGRLRREFEVSPSTNLWSWDRGLLARMAILSALTTDQGEMGCGCLLAAVELRMAEGQGVGDPTLDEVDVQRVIDDLINPFRGGWRWKSVTMPTKIDRPARV